MWTTLYIFVNIGFLIINLIKCDDNFKVFLEGKG